MTFKRRETKAVAVHVRERLELMRNGLVNYLGTFLPGLIGLVVVPIMFRSLPASEYGVWIAALSLRTLVGGVDLGLGWGVRRRVAEGVNQRAADSRSFLESIGAVYIGLAALDGVLLGAGGFVLSGLLHLSIQDERLARVVFAFAAVTVVGDQLFSVVLNALQGLQRFDLASASSTAKIALQAAGTIGFLLLGQGLVAVAAWHATVSFLIAVTGLLGLRRSLPELGFRLSTQSIRALRSHARFSLASQLTQTAFSVIFWVPPLLLGAFRGSSSIVPYHIGQKFPLAIATLSERCAEVGFTSASRHASMGSTAGLRQTLEVLVRWPLILAFPLFCVVGATAPYLLSLWLGAVPAHSTLVLRITSIALLADTVAVGAMHVLWGSGAVGKVLPILAGMAATSTAFTLVLVPSYGVAGAAAALVPATVVGSLAMLRAAARAVRITLLSLLLGAARGLVVPFGVVATSAFGLAHLSLLHGWTRLAFVTGTSAIAYVAALYFLGGRPEERQLIRTTLAGLTPTGFRERGASND